MINLIVQKETFNSNKIKAILKSGENLVSKLQEDHCFEFQLVAKTDSSPTLIDNLINTAASYKTKYGKDWYEFDVEGLTKIVNIFLESGPIYIDLKIISKIFGFSFNLIPLVKKEVKVKEIVISKENKLVEKEEIENLLKDYDITPPTLRKKEKKRK